MVAKEENALSPVLRVEDKAQTLSTRQPQRMVTVLRCTDILAVQYLIENSETCITSKGKKSQNNQKKPQPTQHSIFYFYSCSSSMSFVDRGIPEASYLCLLLVLDY